MIAKDRQNVGVEKLLARGSRVFAIAALAHAHGDGKWYALAPETVAAAREILDQLKQRPDPAVLESVVQAALAPEPATRPPSWVAPLFKGKSTLEQLGTRTRTATLKAAFGPVRRPHSNRHKALAALAIGFSRSPDILGALAAKLSEDEGEELLRMSCLTQTQVHPGEPSAMRAKIRRFLAEVGNG